MTAAIVSGSDSECDTESIQAVADVLRQCFRTSLAATLVVSTDTSSHQFARVQEISGFVVGASGTNVETARSVFLCLAMLMAPKTLNGIDLTDLLPVLGTEVEPTVLVDALWLRDGEGRIHFASSADAHAVESAACIVAVPLIDGPWTWSELRRLGEAVRGQSVEADRKVFFAADGAIRAGLFLSRLSMVPILCMRHALPLVHNEDENVATLGWQ